MRPMSIACAVSVIIACVCVMNNAAVPFSQNEVRLEKPVETEAAQRHDHGEATTLTEEMSPEVLFRTKRQSHLSLCRYCCNCCKNKGCGFCCRF
uniref:Hepcidin n=1 Tax=Tachysurus fulvidraco TaxID=1234273 RepID=A9LS55_TACFU|nr:hepcidin [Tachysurus fulvidraco]